MLIPPYTGNAELDSFLVDLSSNAGTGSSGAAGIYFNNEPLSGEPVGYQDQFIHIKYADDNQGANLSNTPAFKNFFGVYNSTSSTESVNPADYTWYEVSNGFGSLKQLYYLVIGGRNIKFAVDENQPDYRWKVDAGLAIDIDITVPLQTITFNEILDETISELNIASGAVTAAKTNIAALDQVTGGLTPNSVSAAQILDDAVTALKIADGSVLTTKIENNAITSDKVAANAIGANQIAANAVTAVKIEAGSVIAEKIATDAITSDKIAANAITALKIDAGAVTAGKLDVGAVVAGNIAVDAVTANSIAAGAVTADKMDVINLSAITADMGDITAGSLSINSKFSVDSGGNVVIQSSPTGARMEIRNNTLKVFDSSGTLRVHLGDLSQ